MEDASVGVSSSEPGVEGDDEIDEFIKKHLDDDEDENDATTHEKLTAKAK